MLTAAASSSSGVWVDVACVVALLLRLDGRLGALGFLDLLAGMVVD